ncbi:hypothetical protein Gotur_026959, partial [Gossypium turneri]
IEKTSSALWKRLETLYATKSLANRLVLKQRLFTFRMNEGELIRDHISQFITLLNDLKNVEVHIDDEDQTMPLLCFLPPSYKSFRETLIYGRDKLSFEDVNGHFLGRDRLDNEFGLDSKADRREEGMTVSLKRDSLLDAGFEKLGHCVHENQIRVSFNLAVYKSKARSLLVSKHRFDSINSLHSSS